MFRNRYNNNSKKQLSSFLSIKTFNKKSFSGQNDDRDKNLRKRLGHIRNKILRKEYMDSLKEYSSLKSSIHFKEKKETLKMKRLDETVYNIKNLERNVNYSNILKFMDMAFNKDNPFKNYNLKNKIDELENFNKNIYKNKIGIILNKKILHGVKIKGKVDAGNKTEIDFDKLYQKIKDSQVNFNRRKINQKRKNIEQNKFYTIKDYKYKNNPDYLDLDKDESNIKNNIMSGQTINNEITNLNNIKNKKFKLGKSKSPLYLNNLFAKISDEKKSLNNNYIFHRNKKVELNENDNDKIWSKNSSINKSFSSNSFYRPLSNANYKNQIGNIKSNKRKSYFKPNNNNLNRTIVNSKSSIRKYTFLIDGLYNDFQKIKSNTTKLLNKYKEWGFSSGKEIDEIVRTKEDMLLFHLKQKYFKNLKHFPKYKIRKRINISMVSKIKHDFDLIDEEVKRY